MSTPANLALKGLAITMAGVAVLSLDAPLVRLIEADAWTVVVWRSLLMAVGFSVLALAAAPRGFLRDLRTMGRWDLLAAAAFGASNVFFVASAKLIPVANLLLIIATVPLSAAAFSWLLLGERLRLGTAIAIAVALSGIGVLVAGELTLGDSLAGHALAVASTLCSGLFFTLLRRGRARGSGPILTLGALAAGLAMLPLAWPASRPADSIPYALLLGLGVMPVAFTLIAQGPRYLPATDAAFLMLMETVLGPIWAWFLLSEMPSERAFLGGAIVVLAVAGHVLSLRLRRTQPAA
ncbi:MAG: DMT family transporter [Alphaproteobacteria bacterium]|nr:DMT family transporter [Alphaproteobacteria bacterium]MDX5368731.1 DMT family transporter [Alphaproteobacteria bacterium]MDX5463473.1 DMT family transporter [Alphaproteobacteria bacterium]